MERSLAIHPLVDEAENTFISYILQYYDKNPLPYEILLPKDLDIASLQEILTCRIVQPLKGDKLKLVEMVEKNAKESHYQKFELAKKEENRQMQALSELSSLFHKKIETIEMLDNSHIQGSFNVSGCIVYRDGLPSKKDYRYYRLGAYVSDLDSMKEVIYRRYFRILKEQRPVNDLLIVDGGWQQIEAAKEIIQDLEMDVTIAGLLKDEHHRTSKLMDSEGNILPMKKDGALFFLMTQMQDEVHRFAITYHRKLRNKAMTKSILDEVEGIGEVRKKEIWHCFKTLKQLKQARVEEIAKIVPMQVAQDLYELCILNDGQN